jgi:hypothetical protein
MRMAVSVLELLAPEIASLGFACRKKTDWSPQSQPVQRQPACARNLALVS